MDKILETEEYTTGNVVNKSYLQQKRPYLKEAERFALMDFGYNIAKSLNAIANGDVIQLYTSAEKFWNQSDGIMLQQQIAGESEKRYTAIHRRIKETVCTSDVRSFTIYSSVSISS